MAVQYFVVINLSIVLLLRGGKGRKDKNGGKRRGEKGRGVKGRDAEGAETPNDLLK